MERGRDRRYDERDKGYGTETYRPTERHGRSSPRGENYRVQRSPPRPARTPTTENYMPRGARGYDRPRSRSPRRRSRSPVPRGPNPNTVGGYRGRARSPPRGNGRPRSPVPARRYSRSPTGGNFRARSPLPPKRGREITPPGAYRQRSPHPTKQGRFVEPGRDGYDRRGYSPRRQSPARFQQPRENNHRPRERSRTPPRAPAHVSRGDSPMSSRRSSPHMHPDRMVAEVETPAYGHSRRHAAEPRSPPHRVRESAMRRAPSPVPPSPPLETSGWRDRSPPPRERDQPGNGMDPNHWSHSQAGPPAGYGSRRGGEGRAPPNGPVPSRYEHYPSDHHSGPPSAPISMSAHNRPSSASVLTAPSRPRGGPTYGRDDRRDAPYGGPPPYRGGRHYNGPPPMRQSSYDGPGIPTGPRGGYGSEPAPRHDPPRLAFRSNNSSSTTYPRTQRFNSHLGSMPAVVEGGRKLPSGLDVGHEKRLQQLEEDKRKLMEAIEEKQRIKRQGLREWEKSERESARDGLRSELAEGHLDRLAGDGGMTGAAY